MNNLNLPNLFTGLRLLAAPGVVWFMLEDNWEAAFWLFLAAALTDGIDGWLARRLNQTTALGAALDTVTDKALGLGVLIVLAVLALVPVWITLAIVLRDAVVVLGALAYKGVAGHLEIQPTLLGKTYTFVEFAMLTLVLATRRNCCRASSGSCPCLRWCLPRRWPRGFSMCGSGAARRDANRARVC